MRNDIVHRITFELQIQSQLISTVEQASKLLVFTRRPAQVYGQQGKSNNRRDSGEGHSPAGLLNAVIMVARFVQ